MAKIYETKQDVELDTNQQTLKEGAFAVAMQFAISAGFIAAASVKALFNILKPTPSKTANWISGGLAALGGLSAIKGIRIFSEFKKNVKTMDLDNVPPQTTIYPKGVRPPNMENFSELPVSENDQLQVTTTTIKGHTYTDISGYHPPEPKTLLEQAASPDASLTR